MTSFPTLPIGPFDDVSMDFVRLREEGLRLLGRLGGEQWTDYNTHDPGLTILEQLCYALTDLGYRITYPMPALLGDRVSALPGAERILTTDPVTLGDLARVVLDVDGIENASIEPHEEQLPFYYHAGSREIRLRVDPSEPDATPIQLRGVDRVVIQSTETVPAETAIRDVATRVHAGRALCTDVDIDSLQALSVQVIAQFEVERVDDPTGFVEAIVERVRAYLAPKAVFTKRRDAGRSDEVFDGPLLDHGVISVLPEKRSTIYVSDLLHVILDVPGVKAVRSLVLRGESGADQRWALDVPPGHMAVLSPTSSFELFRRDLPLRVEAERVETRSRAPALAAVERAPAPVVRSLTRFQSLQYQFPALYGIGALGLPASAPADRRAQARQLAVFLLIFDQLLANSIHQVAHAAELLAVDEGATATYFTEPVTDDRLALDALRVQSPAAHRAWLETAIETGDALERRKRFLAHLLARFSEELGDHVLLDGSSGADATLIADRRAFLRAYPMLSASRGSGHDVLHDDTVGGFEARLRHKLGLRAGSRLHVIEHILLRPVRDDRMQLAVEGEPEVPLLADVASADPWSLHVSVVLREQELAVPSFEPLVEQVIKSETPAHLTVHLHWFGVEGPIDHWALLEQAWTDFRQAHRAYRTLAVTGRTIPLLVQLVFRDARDRVIDLLHLSDAPDDLDQKFGRTYPLRDLPVPAQIVVAPGRRATIVLGYSQPGTTYELRYADGRVVLEGGAPIRVLGTGGAVELVTPVIDVNTNFRILATKPSGRAAWLRTIIHVIEGVDRAVVAQIVELPLLDDRIDRDPSPGDARLAHWNVQAKVEVLESQEGVTYQVIRDAADLSDPANDVVLSQAVAIGTSGTITLVTTSIAEDVDLRVRATKTGIPTNPNENTAVLDVVLPLRIRANRAVAVEIVPAVVAVDGTAEVEIVGSQTSARYQLHRGRVRDLHFVRGADPWSRPTITVDGTGVVLVRPPQPADNWTDIAGYLAEGDALPGTNARLALPITAFAEDRFFVVKASKRHESGPLGTGSEIIESHVQLDTALALLVQPDATRELRLSAIYERATVAALEVGSGQPGVFYTFHVATAQIAAPAYFHQRDDLDGRFNKGLDQHPDLPPSQRPPPTSTGLVVDGDFVIVRDGATGDPATRRPPDPLLVVDPPAPPDAVVDVVARKAMSGLELPLAKQALLAAMPAMLVEPDQAVAGQIANVVIEDSVAAESYWLELDGARIGDVVQGTGARIELPTPPVDSTTVFVVVATRVDATRLTVERRATVTVLVA